MKLKYYLKGFGIGVIFATLILSISFYSRKDNSNHTSREEIERLAAAYGMIYPQETTKEENLISDREELETFKERDGETKEGEANQETRSVEEIETNKEDRTDGEMEESGEAESSRETETSEEAESSRETETSREDGSSRGAESMGESQSVQQDVLMKEITITVASGMYASSIAELLEETGVIEDAQEFSLYLIGEGYTRRLQAGVYTFTEGMDFKTIAGKLLWETD